MPDQTNPRPLKWKRGREWRSLTATAGGWTYTVRKPVMGGGWLAVASRPGEPDWMVPTETQGSAKAACAKHWAGTSMGAPIVESEASKLERTMREQGLGSDQSCTVGEELEQEANAAGLALAACRALVAAYAKGEESGDTDWQDVDDAHTLAVEALKAHAKD